MTLNFFSANLIIATCFFVGCGRDEEKHSNSEQTDDRDVPSSHQPQLGHQPKPSRIYTDVINEESLPAKRLEILKDIEGLIGRPVSNLTSAEWRLVLRNGSGV